jgi:hypothetical protein
VCGRRLREWPRRLLALARGRAQSVSQHWSERILDLVTDPFAGEPMSDHPATELIAAYLSGTLPPTDQAMLDAHLAECRDCRHEMTSARRLLRSHASRNPWSVAVPIASAAILALVLLHRGPRQPGDSGEPLRTGGEGTAVNLAALAPADRDTVDGHAISFMWGSQVDKPLYRLTVTDGSGHAVWLGDTSDTVLALPAEVTLEPRRTYFWFVDALDARGGTLTTGTHRFTVAP